MISWEKIIDISEAIFIDIFYNENFYFNPFIND